MFLEKTIRFGPVFAWGSSFTFALGISLIFAGFATAQVASPKTQATVKKTVNVSFDVGHSETVAIQEPTTQSSKVVQESNEIPENFRKENLVVWCIVPFDAKNRGPAERAEMVERLGLKRVAYDWRKKHILEFEDEILAYKKHGLEYFAFWGWHESMEELIKKHEITPQIWSMFRGQQPSEGTVDEKVKIVADQFLPDAKKAKSLGLKFGIYNHGGWAGEPKNLVAVCELLRTEHGLDNVGIVYNFHHGHADIEDFEARFKLVQPYLLCLNINGMVDANLVDKKSRENKILPLGSGKHEEKMIRHVIGSGYEGPVGVLGHRKEMDAEESVGLNLKGLHDLLSDEEKGSTKK
jgi:hypothetical protein